MIAIFYYYQNQFLELFKLNLYAEISLTVLILKENLYKHSYSISEELFGDNMHNLVSDLTLFLFWSFDSEVFQQKYDIFLLFHCFPFRVLFLPSWNTQTSILQKWLILFQFNLGMIFFPLKEFKKPSLYQSRLKMLIEQTENKREYPYKKYLD